jgi:hypothetical protein
MRAHRRLKQEFADLVDSDEARWNAVLHRDARLDGLLYYGVATTGIYCRPVCRARRPKIENVAFFRSPDDAEKAGYRACKLCKPTRAARPLQGANLSIRPVAVMFLDIKGYSRLAAAMRPDETFALLDDFHRRTAAIVEAHGGIVHKHLGDGFMALFGARTMKSSDARRGIACGLALVDATAEWNAERRGKGQSPVEIGVGVHYGMTAFGPAGRDQCREPPRAPDSPPRCQPGGERRRAPCRVGAQGRAVAPAAGVCRDGTPPGLRPAPGLDGAAGGEEIASSATFLSQLALELPR